MIPFPIAGRPRAGFAAPYGGDRMQSLPGGGIRMAGDARAYLVEDWQGHPDAFEMLDLRGKTLSFTADVSGVACSCNAALYLVAMQPYADYCDIQSTPHCLEFDLFEANSQAIQATVHTKVGVGGDGTCNQWGCAVNWGNFPTTAAGLRSAALYGRGGHIDTAAPFRVAASVSEGGELSIVLSQAASSRIWRQ